MQAVSEQKVKSVVAPVYSQTRSGVVLAFYYKFFRDSRRMTIWLTIGLALYNLMVISFFPAMVEQKEQMNEMLEAYPEGLISMMTGGRDISEFDVANPGTFLNVESITWLLLIVGAVVISRVFNAFTNAERDNTLDVMLSLPVSRRELFIGHIASVVAMLLIVLTGSQIALMASTKIWPEFDPSSGSLALGIYGMFFPLMVVAAFTYFLVSVIPSSKKYAGAIVYLAFIGSYLIYGLSGLSDALSNIQPFLLFDYYNADLLINEGVNIGDWLVMIAATLIFLGLAWWQLDEKEMGV